MAAFPTLGDDITTLGADIASPPNFSRPFPSPMSSPALSDPPGENKASEDLQLCSSSSENSDSSEPPAPSSPRGRELRRRQGRIALSDLGSDSANASLRTSELENKHTINPPKKASSSKRKMRTFRGTPSRPAADLGRRLVPVSPERARLLNLPVIDVPIANISTAFASTSTVSTNEIDETLEPGGDDKPLLNFRPHVWRFLDRDRQILNLDLFWPQTFDDDSDIGSDVSDANEDVFPLVELRPIVEFRRLKTLRLSGMLISYQRYIWQACWLNPGLEDLTIEMALEPEITKDSQPLWTKIEGNWEMKEEEDGSTEYLGVNGEGTLNPDYGSGEYLDVNAITTAKHKAAAMGVKMRYLPVVNLVLAGFVINAGPFVQSFNRMRLRHIEFKRDCIDAGFALHAGLKQVVTVSPGHTPSRGRGFHTEKSIAVRAGDGQVKEVVIGPKKKVVDEADVGGLAKKVGAMLHVGRKKRTSPSPQGRSGLTGRRSRGSSTEGKKRDSEKLAKLLL